MIIGSVSMLCDPMFQLDAVAQYRDYSTAKAGQIPPFDCVIYAIWNGYGCLTRNAQETRVGGSQDDVSGGVAVTSRVNGLFRRIQLTATG